MERELLGRVDQEIESRGRGAYDVPEVAKSLDEGAACGADDDQVDVAPRIRFPARPGTEHVRRLDPMATEHPWQA